MDDLVRRAIDVNHQLLALGNETFEAAAGIFVRNRGVRHRGLATALIHHCVAGCRKHGAGPVLIVARSDDSPEEHVPRARLPPPLP